jgi:hypothetical protein
VRAYRGGSVTLNGRLVVSLALAEALQAFRCCINLWEDFRERGQSQKATLNCVRDPWLGVECWEGAP